MKRTIKLLALIAAFAMVFTTLFACQPVEPVEPPVDAPDAPITDETPPEEPPEDDTVDLPRNETLYFAGQQWGDAPAAAVYLHRKVGAIGEVQHGRGGVEVVATVFFGAYQY